MADTRLLIAASGTEESPHAHLDPVVAAEVSWGNRIVRDWYITDWHFGFWDLRLERPFHVELLRSTFRFPPNVKLFTIGHHAGGQEPKMGMGDGRFVGITAPLPQGRPTVDREIEL
ncbi:MULTISPECIES: hypothetical protein [Streptomycetaceae]|nr:MULTISPECIES: hypothetical protein [Streptomycetaceae]MYS57611.1 hypothetical protein [Streptomyces sp. SID5468]CCB73210.1 protein of unknown function [Streptantibioticus cattleyicolor NRRL 8057 = DSM 46488]